METDQERRAKLLEAAAHEAGHAVAHWYLDRTRCLGRSMPPLHHVAISRDGEPVLSLDDKPQDASGLCAARPCVNPSFPVWQAQGSAPNLRDLRRRCYQGAMADIVGTMAGPIAQARHAGTPIADAQDWRDRTAVVAGIDASDFEQVEERLEMLGRLWGRRVLLCRDRAFELADGLVRDHQLHILALALELVRHGSVDGAEIFALFDGIDTG